MLKKFLLFLGLAFLLLDSLSAFAGNYSAAPNAGQTFYQDMSVTNVPATFGSGSQLVSGLSKSQSFEICNSSSTPLAGCSNGTVANCAGCTANFVVPANGCTGFNRDQVQIGGRICVQGLPASTSVSTGTVYGAVR